MAEAPSPNPSIGVFFAITSVYFIIKYMWDNTPKKDLIYFVIYILLLLISNYFLNLYLTTLLCGTAQIKKSLTLTLFPWIIIFGLLQVALTLYPGWLIPFSNTIGYGIAKIAGLSQKFSTVVKSPENAPKGSSIRNILDTIYNDKSLLINEIPNSNLGFDIWWKESLAGGLIKKDAKLDDKLALRKLIKLKNIVSEFLWFTLTGLLTISASYNFIIKSSCEQSVSQMEDKHKEYEDIINDNSKNNIPKTVYTSYE